MAYPRYIGKSSFASGAGDLSVAALTGTQAGDIILLFVESANQTISTPSGYSVLATQVGTGTAAAAGGVRIATFYRILADTADTSTTVVDSGNHTTAIKMLFRDTPLIQGNFFVATTSTQTATTSMVFPSVTTATDESLVVLSVALDTDADSTATVGTVTNANLSNITERHDQTVSTNAGGGLAVITGEKTTAGSTGTSTATGSTSVTRAYTTISLSRVTNQTTTTSFNDLSGDPYQATSDALLITAGSTGIVNAVASGTYTPDGTQNGIQNRNFRWYYREYGTDAWTKTTAVAQTVNAVVIGGVVDTVGEFSVSQQVTGLTDGVTYEFALFSARGAVSGSTTVISFSGTAEVSLPPAGYTITADGGTFSYTGGAANTLFNKKVAADAASFSYSGNTVDLKTTRVLTADSGSYAYTGTVADLEFGRKLVADGGLYTYTGQIADLEFGRKLTADAVSFALTGQNAGLLYKRLFQGDAASFAYNGQDVSFKVTRTLSADAGSFNLSGTAADLEAGRKLVADTRSYSYTLQDATLRQSKYLFGNTGSFTYGLGPADLIYTETADYVLTADAGSYALTGNASAFNRTYVLAGNAGSYSYSGTAANLLSSRKLIADTRSYSYAGVDASFLFSKMLSANGAVYVVSGQAADFRRTIIMQAAQAVYLYSGVDAQFVASRKLSADSTSYSYTGQASTFAVNRRLSGEAVNYALTGQAATFRATRQLVADTSGFTYSGSTSGLYYNRKVAADSGSFAFSLAQADFIFESGISKAYLGTVKLTDIRLGTFQVYEAYIGTVQFWGRSRPLNMIMAEPTLFAHTGSEATFYRGRKVVANGMTYSFSAANANLLRGRYMQADAVSYSLTGQPATLLDNVYQWARYATVSDGNASGSSSITATFNTNGTVSFTTSAGDDGTLDTDFTHWHDGGTVTNIGNSRWAKKTSFGDATSGTLTTSLVALSSAKTISIQTVGGETRTGEDFIEIYSDSNGTTKVGEITFTITATI